MTIRHLISHLDKLKTACSIKLIEMTQEQFNLPIMKLRGSFRYVRDSKHKTHIRIYATPYRPDVTCKKCMKYCGKRND